MIPGAARFCKNISTLSQLPTSHVLSGHDFERAVGGTGLVLDSGTKIDIKTLISQAVREFRYAHGNKFQQVTVVSRAYWKIVRSPKPEPVRREDEELDEEA